MMYVRTMYVCILLLLLLLLLFVSKSSNRSGMNYEYLIKMCRFHLKNECFNLYTPPFNSISSGCGGWDG